MPSPGHRYVKGPKLMTRSMWREQPVVFTCENNRLIGITTLPEHPVEIGIVIVVGGPQYRSGSHRQFTLLARQVAEQGIASFRFDYRGMGDSEGDVRNFENINEDIRAAIDTFMTEVPQLRNIAIWGLCDAASAALYYGHTDQRVSGLILLNPWVHSPEGAARARLKYYYLTRLMQKSFWAKLASGKMRVSSSLTELAKSTAIAALSGDSNSNNNAPLDQRHGSTGYINRMLEGFLGFRGLLFIILSGKDQTAQEFSSLIKSNNKWKKRCKESLVSIKTLDAANHTFSTSFWRYQVGTWVIDWTKVNMLL